MTLAPSGRRAAVWRFDDAGNEDIWEVDLTTGVLSRLPQPDRLRPFDVGGRVTTGETVGPYRYASVQLVEEVEQERDVEIPPLSSAIDRHHDDGAGSVWTEIE